MKNPKTYIILGQSFLLFLVLSSFVFASTNNTNSTTSLNTTTVGYKIYAVITGTSTGKVTGDSNDAGHVGDIIVISYSSAITSSIDPTTGQASGTKAHSPFKMTIEMSKASPVLLNMLATGEIITTAVFNFYKVQSDGTQVNFYKIKLDNAIIAHYSGFGNTYGNYETYTFTYQKITWTDVASSTSFSDDWSV